MTLPLLWHLSKCNSTSFLFPFQFNIMHDIITSPVVVMICWWQYYSLVHNQSCEQDRCFKKIIYYLGRISLEAFKLKEEEVDGTLKTPDLHDNGHLAYTEQKPKSGYNVTIDVYQVTVRRQSGHFKPRQIYIELISPTFPWYFSIFHAFWRLHRPLKLNSEYILTPFNEHLVIYHVHSNNNTTTNK